MNARDSKIKPVNCSNDREMVMEGLRKPLVQPKEISAKKPKEHRQMFRKLAKEQLLENKTVLTNRI